MRRLPVLLEVACGQRIGVDFDGSRSMAFSFGRFPEIVAVDWPERRRIVFGFNRVWRVCARGSHARPAHMIHAASGHGAGSPCARPFGPSGGTSRLVERSKENGGNGHHAPPQRKRSRVDQAAVSTFSIS
jgi:hypothetical protein